MDSDAGGGLERTWQILLSWTGAMEASVLLVLEFSLLSPYARWGQDTTLRESKVVWRPLEQTH